MGGSCNNVHVCASKDFCELEERNKPPLYLRRNCFLEPCSSWYSPISRCIVGIIIVVVDGDDHIIIIQKAGEATAHAQCSVSCSGGQSVPKDSTQAEILFVAPDIPSAELGYAVLSTDFKSLHKAMRKSIHSYGIVTPFCTWTGNEYEDYELVWLLKAPRPTPIVLL